MIGRKVQRYRRSFNFGLFLQARYKTQDYNMIWKFDNSNTYLLGCIHAMKPGRHHLSDQIDRLYAESTHIGFELNSDVTRLSTLLRYSDTDNLRNHISRKLFRQAQRQWAKYGFSSDMGNLKPWVVADELLNALVEKHGYSKKYGVDYQLFDRAKKDKKTIVYLESPGVSLSYSDSAPENEQARLLSAIVETPDIELEEFCNMVKAWESSDIDSLQSILNRFSKNYPILYESLLVRRNSAWKSTIAASIDSGKRSLFAMGTLHIVGERSLHVQMRHNGPPGDRHGYTATQIK